MPRFIDSYTKAETYSRAEVDFSLAAKRAAVNTFTTYLNLPIMETDKTYAAPYGNNLNGWTLTAAGFSIVTGEGVIPADTTGANFTIRLMVGSASSGQVRLGGTFKTIASGGSLSSAMTSLTAQDVSLTANTLLAVDFSTSTAATAGNYIACRMQRDGDHANDTLAASAYFHAVLIGYSATV